MEKGEVCSTGMDRNQHKRRFYMEDDAYTHPEQATFLLMEAF